MTMQRDWWSTKMIWPWNIKADEVIKQWTDVWSRDEMEVKNGYVAQMIWDKSTEGTCQTRKKRNEKMSRNIKAINT